MCIALVNQSSQKGHSCKFKGLGGEDPDATSPCSTEVSSGRTSSCSVLDGLLHICACQCAESINEPSRLSGCSHRVFEETMTAQTVWKSLFQNLYLISREDEAEKKRSSVDSQQVDDTCAPDVARCFLCSLEQLSCFFCGLSRWPGHIFTAWTK